MAIKRGRRRKRRRRRRRRRKRKERKMAGKDGILAEKHVTDKSF